MPNALIEEKKNYGIDCRNAIWASDEIHTVYHSCGLPEILCDADFVVETGDDCVFRKPSAYLNVQESMNQDHVL